MNMLMQSHLSSVALTSYNGLVFFGQHLSRLIISFLSLFCPFSRTLPLITIFLKSLFHHYTRSKNSSCNLRIVDVNLNPIRAVLLTSNCQGCRGYEDSRGNLYGYGYGDCD